MKARIENYKASICLKDYQYDFRRNLILMEARENGILVRRSGLSYEGSYYDVLDVIMMMRYLMASHSSVTLPTIVNFSIKDTDLNFTDEVKEIKVKALDRSVRARRVEGKAYWKAWAGVTGKFMWWFSDDKAAIPLKIYLKIFLGSVTLELEQLHRPYWVWSE